MEGQARTAAPLRERLATAGRSDTARAAGLAVATAAQQLTALVFTIVFARILGADGYGALAALINFTVILIVPGSALQVAAARQGTLGRLGSGADLAATLDRWTRQLLVAVAAIAVVSVLAREPLADLVNIEEQWAAAAVPVTAAVWMLVCVQRGLLQAARAYKPVALSIVAEGFLRIAGAAVLVAASMGVTGAFLGLLVAWTTVAIVLHRLLRRRLGAPAARAERHRLSALAANAAVPVAGLVFVAALQNVDVIMARHALDEDTAGVYAAATVAAKFIVWVSVGIGLWTLPEATRRAAAGLDPRPVLWRALGVVALIAVPALGLFAAFPNLILRVAFGSEFASGDEVLLLLGAAFALLAVTFVTVQFLLGLHRRAFVLGLMVAAAAEPVLLWNADDLRTFAVRVLLLQAVTAVAVVAVGVLTRRDEHAGEDPVLTG